MFKPLKKVRFGFFLKKVDGQGVCGENYPSRFSEISIIKQNTKVWFKIKWILLKVSIFLTQV